MLETRIKKVTERFNSQEGELNRLIGRRDTLIQQIDVSQAKISTLEEIQKLDEKAIEVLNLDQGGF